MVDEKILIIEDERKSRKYFLMKKRNRNRFLLWKNMSLKKESKEE